MDTSSSCVYYNGTFTSEATRALKVMSPLGVLICLGGLVGNGLVLGLLVFSVKWGGFTVFIFHLSLADFLYLSGQTVWFMQIILDTFHGIWFDVEHIYILTDTSYTAGLCLLAAISVGRCLSVLCPIWCRLRAPRHAPAALCSLAWVLSLSVNVHLFLVCWGKMPRNHEFCCVYEEIIFGFFCVLLSVMVLCVVIVPFKVMCSTQLRPPLKFYVSALLTALFLLCAFPYGIHLYYTHYSGTFHLPHLLLLSCVNSSANPLVYYFVGRIGGRRQGGNFRQIFQKTLGEETGVRRDTSSGAVSSSA
ncbi:mas-related G-protein coupled receptor member B4-like [Pteronotus mesoamericanus]|uniref:mas-related G-protein coupled receptor member B4-like n=1 Tax=Pteronotus mesoamericanus TaxID=1884717 RepID=UPI0023ED4A2D|nr:mas-related G-protein coupled receptor member B4-like [Pteronotus parnellii mesoamericanus]